MKELSIEEKAKAYDIALDKIKMLLGTGNSCSREELEYVFPELKESKDERMMKIIMNALIKVPHSDLDGLIPDTIRIWLEGKIKQDEEKVFIPKFRIGDIVKSKSQPMLDSRIIISIDKDCYRTKGGGCIGFALEKDYELIEEKPTGKTEPNFKAGDWDEYDEKMLENIIAAMCNSEFFTFNEKEDAKNFLKSLKDRVQPQPKQEWSKEDEEIILKMMFAFKTRVFPSSEECGSFIDFLKSLKHTWKPSNEQIIAIEYATDLLNTYHGQEMAKNGLVLLELLKQLKAL